MNERLKLSLREKLPGLLRAWRPNRTSEYSCAPCDKEERWDEAKKETIDIKHEKDCLGLLLQEEVIEG